MKTLYSLSFAITIAVFNSLAYSQSYCGSDRYDKEVFSNFTKATDITYGQNIPFGSTTPQILKMDIYQPSGDSVTQRPLIIWVHGGSFIGGTKADPDVVAFCQKFSKRGYVTASINYRLFYYPLNDANQAKKAVMRAVQDLKAAIRFFRKDAFSTNTYQIDTNNIFIGGSSAGALTALHLAYLDTDAEFAAEIDTTGLGGLEGTSGNPGYLSTAHAVVNLCGALGNANYLVPGDEPLLSMHGTVDGTVPYATAPIPQVPSLTVDGSYSINLVADNIGITNKIYTWFGADHVPYVSGGTATTQAAYMDTTVRFISNFLYESLQCSPSDPSPFPNTFTTINENLTSVNGIGIYPNPSNGKFQVSAKSQLNNYFQKIEIYNMLGEIIYQKENIKQPLSIDFSTKESGIYFLKTYSSTRQDVQKIIIN